MFQPLKGIQIVDLTLAAAGPSCTKQLVELGAEDVWVEPLGGVSTRSHHKYDFYTANKRSIPLDLKSAEGMEVMLRLVRNADVFVTNYRLRSVRKLGLDYENLKKINPRLIYAAITGYGTEGDEANSPGTDTSAFWARAGLMRDYAEKGTLVVPPSAMGDCATGMFLAGGILAALYNREKTGEGCDLYTSLLGAAVYLNHHDLVEVQYGDELPHSRKAPSYAFLNSYQCADGWITVNIARADFGRYFDSMLQIIGREDLTGNPRYATVDAALGENAAELVAIMDEALIKMTVAEAMEKMAAANIVVSRVQSTRDTLTDPQVLANHMIYRLEATRPVPGQEDASIFVPACPVKYQGNLDFGIEGQRRGPRLGEHTVSVLRACRYTDEKIRGLLDKGITKKA